MIQSKVSDYIRKGCMIEVSKPKRKGLGRPYRPSYTWVQGWQVFNPDSGNWSVELPLMDARNIACRTIKGLS